MLLQIPLYFTPSAPTASKASSPAAMPAGAAGCGADFLVPSEEALRQSCVGVRTYERFVLDDALLTGFVDEA
jgi:hypothetical protein